jgi:hypothetical protein
MSELFNTAAMGVMDGSMVNIGASNELVEKLGLKMD